MANPEANIALLAVAVSTVLWVLAPHRLFFGVLMLMSLCSLGFMVVNVGKPMYGAMLIIGGVLSFILTVIEISARRK